MSNSRVTWARNHDNTARYTGGGGNEYVAASVEQTSQCYGGVHKVRRLAYNSLGGVGVTYPYATFTKDGTKGGKSTKSELNPHVHGTDFWP